jgi:diguanylate cyclase (GGDEF)-like protein
LLLQSFLGKLYAALVYSAIFVAALKWQGFDVGTQRKRRLTDVFETLTFRQRFEDLQRRAAFDGLTGLKSRATFDEEAPKLLSSGSMLAVVDIDHFKRINDTFGHSRGDSVLRVVAARLRDALPKVTEVYRYGGEEFVILGSITTAELEAVRSSVAESQCDGIAVTISIGATHMKDGLNLRDAFDQADKRLYAAKAAGRNRLITA